eukprot:scaffold7039_cov255-Pinguiococcus_pyrenoidosus.AAC.11
MTVAAQRSHEFAHVACVIHRPHLDGPIPTGRVEEAFATPLHTLHAGRMPRKCRYAAAQARVPYPHQLVLGRRGKPHAFAVLRGVHRLPRHARNPLPVLLHR